MCSIGKKIKQHREKLNMSHQDLALKLRVGATKIEKYESGEQIPNTDTLLKICTVLDIPASELLNLQSTSTKNSF